MLIEILNVLISGITNGSVYAIMAAGMALVYGVTKLFNLAYGSFYSLGGYLAVCLFSMKYGYIHVLIFVPPLLFFAGMATEKLIVRPLRKNEDWEMTAVMVTLGLAMFMNNSYQVIFGPIVKSLPKLFPGNLSFGEITLSNQDMAIFIIAIFTMVSLIMFLGHTRLGMGIEAVAQDMVGAEIVGIPKDLMFGITFAISAVLAGMGGILLAPKYFVSPHGGWDILVKAWVISALGGMGSIRGSLYAAFILGILEAFVGWQIGFTWTLFIWFLVLLLVFIVRPKGLFGTWG